MRILVFFAGQSPGDMDFADNFGAARDEDVEEAEKREQRRREQHSAKAKKKRKARAQRRG